MRQFQLTRSLNITMELDMTQAQSDHAVLRYIIQNDPAEDVLQIITDGEFTNIAWDTIDIEKKYRVVVGIVQYKKHKWVELIQG